MDIPAIGKALRLDPFLNEAYIHVPFEQTAIDDDSAPVDLSLPRHRQQVAHARLRQSLKEFLVDGDDKERRLHGATRHLLHEQVRPFFQFCFGFAHSRW